MNQDGFRQLLSTARPQASRAPPKTVDASQPLFKGFKPRKVAKKVAIDDESVVLSGRAEEIRAELLQQYAVPDEPIKGLNFDLVDQEKARSAVRERDELDDILEASFTGTSLVPAPQAKPETPASRKRTREEIVRDLKAKRAKTADASAPPITPEAESAALKKGKFRPIGAPKEKTTKVAKRKRKDDAVATTLPEPAAQEPAAPTPLPSADAPLPLAARSPPQAPAATEADTGDDVDIFAGVGEYNGLALSDDDKSDGEAETSTRKLSEPAPAPAPGKWFDLSDDNLNIPAPRPPTPPPATKQAREPSPEEQPLRLVPLSSSAIPSIRDVLDADVAFEKEQKRRARKEKKKKGAGGGDGDAGSDGDAAGGSSSKRSAESKANRDYQKLKAFEQKKAK